MNRLGGFFKQRRRWRTSLLSTTSLARPAPALAQTGPDSTSTRPAAATAPIVAASTSAAGGLPSSEFETYESIAVENRSSLNTNLTVGFTYSTGK